MPIVDALIVATIAGLAWRTLVLDSPFNAVVHFIAFGLLVAVAWVRLDAIDVAIAEAAIGAGVTGALLLITLKRLAHPGRADEPADGDG